MNFRKLGKAVGLTVLIAWGLVVTTTATIAITKGLNPLDVIQWGYLTDRIPHIMYLLFAIILYYAIGENNNVET